MTRKKVKLAYIENGAMRKATFKKRKKGLMKKENELSTLCGIESCAIVYSPYDEEPEVWPSALGVRRTIARFRNMSEMDQSKRMMNQVAFIKHQISKAHDHLQKHLRENREQEVTGIMHQALTGLGLGGLNLLDQNDLGWLVDKILREIDGRIKSVKEKPSLTDPKKSATEGTTTAKVKIGEAPSISGDGSALSIGSSSSQQHSRTMYMDRINSDQNAEQAPSEYGFRRTTDDVVEPPFFLPNHDLTWSNSFQFA